LTFSEGKSLGWHQTSIAYAKGWLLARVPLVLLQELLFVRGTLTSPDHLDLSMWDMIIWT
jgi:hypothetical protein